MPLQCCSLHGLYDPYAMCPAATRYSTLSQPYVEPLYMRDDLRDGVREVLHQGEPSCFHAQQMNWYAYGMGTIVWRGESDQLSSVAQQDS